MTFLAPGFLFASLAVAATIAALHFIVTRQPRSSILPTARFVPDTRATTIAPAKRPSDLLPMLLRVLTVLAAGAALARPVLWPSRRPNARVVLVDVSRSARDSLAIRDSVLTVYRRGDALVIFDSAARVVTGNVGDSVARLSPGNKRGNLSAALIAALRAGSSLREQADSLELVIVSPFANEELDPATDSIRRLWRGTARIVRAGVEGGGNVATAAPAKIDISAEADDPLAITVGLVRVGPGTNAFIDRAPLSGGSGATPPANAAAVNAAAVTPAGTVLIDWPATNRPRGAVGRSPMDTIGGVVTTDTRVIAPFERRWAFPADSLRGVDVIARWADGEPAAIERPTDSGCVRSVAIPVATVGDLAIRHDFIRFVTAIMRPCARVTAMTPADPASVARLVGRGGLAPREAFQSPFQSSSDTRSTLAPWLIALAIAAAVSELFVRRRARATTVAADKLSAGEARAA
jgi:hypothetical protein